MATLVQTSEIHRMTLDEYHQLVDSGALEDMHVELIDGLIVDMSPRSPTHEIAVRWLIDWLVAHLDHARFQFMVTGSMTIGASEPEPDVAIFERPAPTRAHPSTALLAIEIAVSSQDRDLRTKPTIYAGAVQEYWVLDTECQRVVVHRDGADGAYREVFAVPRGEPVAPVALALAPLDTEPLFATALGERE